MTVAQAAQAAPYRAYKALPRSQGGFPLFSLGILTFIVGCGWLALSADSLREYMEAHRQRDQQLQQVATLRSEIHQLRARYESARRNGLETERQIRDRLDMRKPGERMLFLKREQPPAGAQDEPPLLPGGSPVSPPGTPARLSAPSTARPATRPPSATMPEEPEGLPAPGTAMRIVSPVQILSDEPEGLPAPVIR
jgi:hypothetical protein